MQTCFSDKTPTSNFQASMKNEKSNWLSEWMQIHISYNRSTHRHGNWLPLPNKYNTVTTIEKMHCIIANDKAQMYMALIKLTTCEKGLNNQWNNMRKNRVYTESMRLSLKPQWRSEKPDLTICKERKTTWYNNTDNSSSGISSKLSMLRMWVH